MSSSDYVLKIEHITKDFPGVRALSDVSFAVKKGTVHGLCGENGAGKSTLMKILSGVYPHGTYEGKIYLEGEEIVFEQGAIRQAIERGIAIVYQELALIPHLTVGENIFLGREPLTPAGTVDWDKLYARTKELLDEFGLDIHFSAKVGSLSVGKQQMVEIAKALSEDARILILDEPTSALSDAEVDTLLSILEKLRKRGVTTIFITHRLNEFFRITDEITVLRDGKVIKTVETDKTDTEELIALMVGREMKERFPERSVIPGEEIMRVENWTVEDPDIPGKNIIEDVSFSVRRGEVFGIAGLMGSGRTELVMSIFGEYGNVTAGRIFIDGEELFIKRARDAMNYGISLVPEERKTQGLILQQSILKNIALPNMDLFSGFGYVDKLKEIQMCEEYSRRLTVKTPSVHVPVNTLSGGNQQKVVISKWLMKQPKVLILDDPTRGIDVGAKYEIYKLINNLVENGVSVILISSELEEVMGMSDRILVMCEGHATGILEKHEFDQERIMSLATKLFQ